MQDKIKVLISDYGYDGEGVAKHNGKVVFVPYALKDENVEVLITKENSSFCQGELIEVYKASHLRCQAPCPYYEKCGGCRYQHTTYENELNIKKEQLKRQLKKVGYSGDVGVVACDEYGYRNKIRLFVGEGGLSLKERKSSRLCPINKCLISSSFINDAIEKINNFILCGNHQHDYSEVVIRQEGECLIVNFYCTNKNDINYQGLFLILGANVGIYETHKGTLTHKVGKQFLECEEFGLNCKFSPTSFHQVNDEVGKRLYQTVLDSLQGKNILNCYSGAGVLSGIITLQGKRVVGVEFGEKEHLDAERLKEENNLFYLTNMQGDCSEVLPKLVEKFETLIVDPPRGGMDAKVVDAINQFQFKRLIYISCNSSTLVRDLERLQNVKVASVALFDMFARTGEYETLVILDKI